MFDLVFGEEVIIEEDDFMNMESFALGLFDEGNALLYTPVGDWEKGINE